MSRAPLRASMGETARRLAADRSGATAIEYAVMTFIAIAIVVVIGLLGDSVRGLYEAAANAFMPQ